MSIFAASWSVGNLLGAVVCVFALDVYGRKPCMIYSSAGTAMVGAGICMLELNLNQIIVLRAAQGAFWSIAMTACQTWYAEFLPTNGRGALLAAPCIGWPIGRGLVILTAGAMGEHSWKAIAAVSAVLFGATFLWWLVTAAESPRFLAINGREEEAREVIARTYAQNGLADPFTSEFDTEAQDILMCLKKSTTSDAHQRDSISKDNSKDNTRECRVRTGQTSSGHSAAHSTYGRLRQLVLVHPSLFAFINGLYVALTVAFTLLDTWGPRLFGQLFAGGNVGSEAPSSLPYRTMLLFNLGDLCGIFISIAIQDRVGRRGCFYIGFFAQAAFLATIAVTAMAAGGWGVGEGLLNGFMVTVGKSISATSLCN
jgi:MFS family permease